MERFFRDWGNSNPENSKITLAQISSPKMRALLVTSESRADSPPGRRSPSEKSYFIFDKTAPNSKTDLCWRRSGM